MYEILNDFKELILSADPKASRYFAKNEADPWTPYTVWTEYELTGQHGGDVYAEPVWRVLVERYTKDQDDAIVGQIMETLCAASGVAFEYSLRRNRELDIVGHFWDCEVAHGAV